MNWQEKIAVHQAVFAQLGEQEATVEAMGAIIVRCLYSGVLIFLVGNGGSAAYAQYFSA